MFRHGTVVVGVPRSCLLQIRLDDLTRVRTRLRGVGARLRGVRAGLRGVGAGLSRVRARLGGAGLSRIWTSLRRELAFLPGHWTVITVIPIIGILYILFHANGLGTRFVLQRSCRTALLDDFAVS